MAIAPKLRSYLEANDILYRPVPHDWSRTAARAAHACHVPEVCFAKSIALKSDDGPVLAVLPASRRLTLGEVWREMHGTFHPMREAELAELFDDCEAGALPPVGEPYGVRTIVDWTLYENPEIYTEAGDHRTALVMDWAEFARLTAGLVNGRIGHDPVFAARP